MQRKTWMRTLHITGILMIASAAQGATLTFDLRSGGTPDNNPSVAFGNVRTMTLGGVTMQLTAWGRTGSGSSFETAATSRYSTGLGVCNQDSTANCGNPEHQVDNVGADDLVLFVFSVPVDPVSIIIDPYGTADRDVSYWVGNIATTNLSGLTVNTLPAGFGSITHDNASSSSDARTVNIAHTGLVNAILFGARIDSGPNDDDDDYFKIRSVTVNFEPPSDESPTPEPATFGLLGAALVGLGLYRRNRA